MRKRDFAHEDDRLQGYIFDDDGTPFPTNDISFLFGGDGGVVSTTSDMATFLTAVLLDQQLISADALALLTDIAIDEPSAENPMTAGIGRGFLALKVEGLGTFVGFNGGTLGFDTISLLHLDSGRIISTAATNSNGPSLEALLATAGLTGEDDAWAALEADPEAVWTIEGVSAADLTISADASGTHLSAEGSTLTLEMALAQLDDNAARFADGSTLHAGSAEGDVILTGRDLATHLGADNQILGLLGDDTIIGADGDERLNGGGGDDFLRGKAGADTLIGGAGDDFLLGDAGDDRIFGGIGDDVLKGGSGIDVIFGGNGNDRMFGEAGNDHLLGGFGLDVLWGGAGNDRLSGGAGADRIIGGAGNDVMLGGLGGDLFVFRGLDQDGVRDLDVITDFEIGADHFQFAGLEIADMALVESGLLLTLSGADGDRILVQDIDTMPVMDDLFL
ncbi:MAG: serine hydrolase [Neomegalonema sp.]|nr:serine hydrolase [Neomegalonema sp.]